MLISQVFNEALDNKLNIIFYISLLGSVVDVCFVVGSSWDLWGWLFIVGGSTPAMREIGKALAGMAPSSCAVKRSTQKSFTP